MHSMFCKSSLKFTEKVGFRMIYLNIHNKYYFSNFTLRSTRDVSYHFFKQNIIARSIETLGVVISKSGYENRDCSVEIFSDRRLGNARLKQTFIFYCVVWARSPVHRSAPLVSSYAPGMD